MLKKLREWLLDYAGNAIVSAVFGSAAVTALVGALARTFLDLPVHWLISLLASTALLAYAGFIKAAQQWPATLGLQVSTDTDSALRPTVEMLEASRRELQVKREQLIKDWRRMVSAVHADLQHAALCGDALTTAAALERRSEFLTFRSHMSDKTREAIYGRTIVVPPDNSVMNGALHMILRDIDHWERTWQLL